MHFVTHNNGSYVPGCSLQSLDDCKVYSSTNNMGLCTTFSNCGHRYDSASEHFTITFNVLCFYSLRV